MAERDTKSCGRRESLSLLLRYLEREVERSWQRDVSDVPSNRHAESNATTHSEGSQSAVGEDGAMCPIMCRAQSKYRRDVRG